MNYALQGIEMLQEQVDSLVVIPNDRIREVIDLKKASMKQAFEEADNVLKQGISSISNLISTSGYVNLDFEDLCTVIRNAGLAHMGMGYAAGENMAEEAASMAISSPAARYFDRPAPRRSSSTSPRLPICSSRTPIMSPR